ncbi:MAG: hypothetical protein KAG61_08690 [Bacteriovoracaceae bacterium]|nr:hypothetical protein [Bacteriovoracaceae bacterium]
MIIKCKLVESNDNEIKYTELNCELKLVKVIKTTGYKEIKKLSPGSIISIEKNLKNNIGKILVIEENKASPGSGSNHPTIETNNYKAPITSIVPTHFYTVFNPMFNTDADKEEFNGKTQAHSFFYSLQQRHKKKKKGEPDAYFYWGKLKVSSGNEPINFESMKGVIDSNNDLGVPTHLYISDFQHLWVAKVDAVEKDISDYENTMEFYRSRKEKIEMWFKITDMSLVAADHEVCLKKLYNLSLNHAFTKDDEMRSIEAINPYLSNLRYPLVIKENEPKNYFVLGEEKWLSRENDLMEDAEYGKYVKSIVNSYVIPQQIFAHVPTMVQEDILYAESLICDKRQNVDQTAMMRQVVSIYLKSLEIIVNQLIVFPLFKSYKDKIYSFKNETISKAYKRKENVTINQLRIAMRNNDLTSTTKDFCTSVNEFLDNYLLSRSLQDVLSEFGDEEKGYGTLRNDLAHEDVEIPLEKLMEVRNNILGVGREGVINKLYMAKLKLKKDELHLPLNNKMSA